MLAAAAAAVMKAMAPTMAAETGTVADAVTLLRAAAASAVTAEILVAAAGSCGGGNNSGKHGIRKTSSSRGSNLRYLYTDQNHHNNVHQDGWV